MTSEHCVSCRRWLEAKHAGLGAGSGPRKAAGWAGAKGRTQETISCKWSAKTAWKPTCPTDPDAGDTAQRRCPWCRPQRVPRRPPPPASWSWWHVASVPTRVGQLVPGQGLWNGQRLLPRPCGAGSEATRLHPQACRRARRTPPHPTADTATSCGMARCSVGSASC